MADDAQAALAAMDETLSKRPQADGHALSAATEHLARWRERLIAERSTGGQRALDLVNAAISIVMATHFPLGEVRWAEFETARRWVADAANEGATNE